MSVVQGSRMTILLLRPHSETTDTETHVTYEPLPRPKQISINDRFDFV